MIQEINVKEGLSSSRGAVERGLFTYIVWRVEDREVVECYGCDTIPEADELLIQLDEKPGYVEMASHKNLLGKPN